MFRDPRLARMASFLDSIGISMRPGIVDVPTIFPGSLIAHGSLVVDETKLFFPGDALHEAAHIALAPPARRGNDFAFVEGADAGEELTAIAWCWAALLRLELAPEDVFHDTAYKRGDSSTISRVVPKGYLHRLSASPGLGDGIRSKERRDARRRCLPAHGALGSSSD